MNSLHHSAVYIVTVVDTKTDGRTKTSRVGPYFEEDAARAADELTAAADLAHIAQSNPSTPTTLASALPAHLSVELRWQPKQ